MASTRCSPSPSRYATSPSPSARCSSPRGNRRYTKSRDQGQGSGQQKGSGARGQVSGLSQVTGISCSGVRADRSPFEQFVLFASPRQAAVIPRSLIPTDPWHLTPVVMADILVWDGLEACPYLPGRMARLPLHLPSRALTPDQVDERLATGERRLGAFWYRTACPGCAACEPLRIDVDAFTPSRWARRVLRRGDTRFHLRVGSPSADASRVALHNAHLVERCLADARTQLIDTDTYRGHFVTTTCDTVELSYEADGRLAMVAIADRGRESLSAVYCYYDTGLARLSPGSYSILKEWQLCRLWGLRYLYLGFYVANSPRMRYKARFVPHERLIDGVWQRF
ncbi:MAG: arginyltransferase [Luteitalea sp.]|nr:arginyltransferase [Luteitalea sp.]